MTNVISTQTIEDGEVNYTTLYAATLTADVTSTTLVDPSLINKTLAGQPTKVKLVDIDYVVGTGLSVGLVWDGATPQNLMEITGRGNINYKDHGGLSNFATTPTGKVLISTTGAATATTPTVTLKLHWQKQFT